MLQFECLSLFLSLFSSLCDESEASECMDMLKCHIQKLALMLNYQESTEIVLQMNATYGGGGYEYSTVNISQEWLPWWKTLV